jgi:hypothetical protein
MTTRTLSLLFAIFACGSLRAASIVATGTNGEEAVRLRAEFLAQALPVSYETHVKAGAHFHLSWIELTGRTKSFATKHSAQELIYAFWPWFDDPAHAPEATILLLGLTGRKMMTRQKLSYADTAHPGNWSELATSCIDECKIECRSALNQPNWWYPHQVLFDRETVLTESKTSAVVRASYIAAMQKALANPKIRTENPLEVKSILETLCVLDAREAAQSVVDYMFYDWRTASDYRLQEGDMISHTERASNKPHNLSNIQLPAFLYLPRFGDACVPLVIARLANATVEERSVNTGGGATPAIAISYFMWLHYTEKQAVDAIRAYKRSHTELTEMQLGALSELLDAIESKKFRNDGLLKNPHPVVRSWAPSATNAPAIK